MPFKFTSANHTLMKLNRTQAIDFGILILRWYLAYYMADYGWSKLMGEQFGIHDPTIMEKPLKHIDKFYLSWYLFSLNRSFDIIVGFSQITGAVLIVINRTMLIGALMLLPILGQIFLVDVAFTMNMFGSILPIRLTCMIVSDLLILLYYKNRMIEVWKILTKNITTRYKYKWWVYLLLPIIGLLMDFVWGIITLPLSRFIDWLVLKY